MSDAAAPPAPRFHSARSQNQRLRLPHIGLCRLGATVIAMLALIIVLGPAATSAAAEMDLPRALEGARLEARLGESRVGYIVTDLQTGDVLASSNEDEPFIPASNMKLLTSGAALAILGPDFLFETELRVVEDTVIIRGSGDPAFAEAELLKEMGVSVDEFVDVWIDALVKDRSRPYAEIVIDDRIFDSDAVHPTWPIEQLNRWYCAEIWGFNFHANIVSLYATPARAIGMSPEVQAEPDIPWLDVQNTARTVRKGSNTLWVARPRGSNLLKLRGNIRARTHQPVDVSLTDMPLLFGRLMAHRLNRRGLGSPSVRRASADESLPEGQLLSVVRTPMDVILRRCNTNSYNLYAEALIKRLGNEITGLPGSWQTGAAAIRMLVQEHVGAREAASIVIADGSGMSRDNRLTPSAVAGWLEAMHQDQSLRRSFMESLAAPAGSGTLRRRFRSGLPDHEVRAKSGYLNGVSALSGYVRNPVTGRTLAFSVMVNDIPRDLPFARVKKFQEDVVLYADEWLDSPFAGAPVVD